LNNGKGDREDPSKFRKIEGPIDLVIVEGWMLGFKQGDSDEQKIIIKNNPGME
jgi:pantothenate kinase-related protein Tda10